MKECHNEDAQCMFVIDKILETMSCGCPATTSFGNFAILYRRQVKINFSFATHLVFDGLVEQTRSSMIDVEGIWESFPSCIP